jgi:hypothetical protein
MNDIEKLAAAYAGGQFDESVKWQKKTLADKEYVKVAGEGARERLKLYEEKKSYRNHGE